MYSFALQTNQSRHIFLWFYQKIVLKCELRSKNPAPGRSMKYIPSFAASCPPSHNFPLLSLRNSDDRSLLTFIISTLVSDIYQILHLLFIRSIVGKATSAFNVNPACNTKCFTAVRGFCFSHPIYEAGTAVQRRLHIWKSGNLFFLIC